MASRGVRHIGRNPVVGGPYTPKHSDVARREALQMTTGAVHPIVAPVALFHPAFQSLGGAEILVATQAECLKESGADVRVVTLAFDPIRWASWFDGIPVRVAAPAPWLERFSGTLTRLKRTVSRTEGLLADCGGIMAVNFPCNVLLGASSIAARRIWCCTEPSRKLHLVATSPRLEERTRTHPGGRSAVEFDYARRMAKYLRARESKHGAALAAFDVEMTRKLDVVFSISEFARDTMHRVYRRTDPGILYPIVRFPELPVRRASGVNRNALQVLTHSRLETVKNVETVLRGFASFIGKGRSANLHIVGEGPERGALERLASQLGVADGVTFHGYLSEIELARVYRSCDVFALLPLDEPFGMVFPEAAARGLLLIGPDHGGPFEIIDGGRLGEACNPFEPDALTAALERVGSLPDAEVDDRRSRADAACRGRYSAAAVGPELRRAFE